MFDGTLSWLGENEGKPEGDARIWARLYRFVICRCKADGKGGRVNAVFVPKNKGIIYMIATVRDRKDSCGNQGASWKSCSWIARWFRP